MSQNQNINNHYSAKLSDLDLKMAVCVPPGGNWKDIPASVPSKRLETIRLGFAAGNGSRSTYYGRLHPERPSYTINTYYNRPGNGCHLHYDFDGGQHRVLSEREAARLQSFPDEFVFLGSHTSIQKQIGNAVPPLLAYQVARILPFAGEFADVFCGAGGLSLGMKWAGWNSLVANDIEPSYLETYKRNVHSETISGDIREKVIFDSIVGAANHRRSSTKPFFLIGGPPCQGFSTAGKKRSLDDDRNHLFGEFKLLLDTLKPDGFIFENVMGLTNMLNGRVFDLIQQELSIHGNRLMTWILKAERHGIPQRRTRLFLVSVPNKWALVNGPRELTSFPLEHDNGVLPPSITVRQALEDLPALVPGENGSSRGYLTEPTNLYQRFLRGRLLPADYLDCLKDWRRNDSC